MRSGSRNIRTNFAAPGLTHFGGIFLLHQFLQQLRFRSYLSQHLHFPQRNNRYSLSELFLALVYPMILGLEKIEVSALLQTNGVFQSITGLPSFSRSHNVTPVSVACGSLHHRTVAYRP